MPKIFVSYSHKDEDFTHKLEKDLSASGAEVWIDSDKLKVGDKIPYEIEESIMESDFFAVVLSPDSVKSEWVKKEVELALPLQEKDGKPTILHIYIGRLSHPFYLEELVLHF